MADANNVQIIRDPNLAKNRIFIGNLPTCTSDELESICLPYGKVLGSLVQKNFGFVQFETEEISNKVAAALTKSIFKGNTITVRNAGHRRGDRGSGKQKNTEQGQAQKSQQQAPLPPNECEIVVLDRKNTKYAEYVEDRLKRLNLRVDVLFPNSIVPLGKVLANISSNGCLYAIIVSGQNEEHNSITVNVLHGQKAEHRNMPMEDAIKLISEDYQNKVAQDAIAKAAAVAAGNSQVGNLIQLPLPILPVAGGVVTNAEGHPEAIRILINLLFNNLQLTVLQYDRLIKYLQERRQQQITNELGEDGATIAPPLPIIDRPPDPEIKLQKQILNIMNKPSVAETVQPKMRYSTLKSVKEDIVLIELLRDHRIQSALDSLMDTAVVTTIEKMFQF